MNYIDEELFNALCVIVETCRENECNSCPLAVAYNVEGDIDCIMNVCRPCHFELGRTMPQYKIGYLVPESEEE